jgi:tRNA modification GTPase
LREALGHLQHGLTAPASHPELLAEDLRLAMRAIGRITGRVDVEELLDFVFRDFCIGK